MTRAVIWTARNSRNVYRAIRKSKIGVHASRTVEQARRIAGARRARAMSEALVPGFVLLRALNAVLKGGDDPEWQIRAAVDAFWRRGNDAKAEREFLHQQSGAVKGSLGWTLSGLEGICGGFSEALGVHLLEWPPRFPPPPGALIAAMAGALVAAEFLVVGARENIKQLEDDHGVSAH